jgi:hypothetical protein
LEEFMMEHMASNGAVLEYRKGELHFQTFFVQPVFGIFHNVAGLSDQVFARLREYGLGLTDMKFDHGGGTAAEWQLTCSLFQHSAQVRFRLDAIEVVAFNLRQLSAGQFGAIALSAVEAVKLAFPTAMFSLHTFAIAIHGVLLDLSPSDFLRQFARPPANELPLGPLSGVGVVFYHGPTAERLKAALTLDLSATVENGLFFRSTASWDGVKTPVQSLPQFGSAFVAGALTEAGLTLKV